MKVCVRASYPSILKLLFFLSPFSLYSRGRSCVGGATGEDGGRGTLRQAGRDEPHQEGFSRGGSLCVDVQDYLGPLVRASLDM